MFKNSRNTKKIIALFLVFTMMFANMFSVVQYAATTLGKQNSGEGHENVKYDAVFVVNYKEEGYSYSAFMKEENLGIKIKLGVKDSGYLKNANINFEADNGLNFNIGELGASEFVQAVNGTNIKLNQMNKDDSMDLTIPITYKDSESIDNLSKITSVKLSGIYVDNEGRENKISEVVKLNLTWMTNTALDVSSELTKYIPYNSDNKSGVIVQTLVKMNVPEKAELVEKESLTIDALKLSGLKLSDVTVIRNNEAEFTEKDWKYNEDDSTISINVKNTNSGEFVKEEFLITYVFEGSDNLQLPINLNSKIVASAEMFGSNEKIEAAKDELYTVNEKIGEIVSVVSSIKEDAINKGNMIADKYNSQKIYTTDYEINHRINISSKDLIDKISITDIEENFKALENSYSTVNSSNYKDVKVAKAEFEKILGKDGKISIMSRGNEIATIDMNSEVDKDNNLVTKVNDVTRVTVNTTAPVSEGNLNIKLDKEIKDTEYDISDVKKFDTISYTSQGNVYISGVQNKVSENTDTTVLEGTKTDADISLNKPSLGTIVNNENVDIKISLNNNKLGTDFYKNPKFEVILPEYIKEVNLKNVGIANAGEDLKIASVEPVVENGRVVIRVNLEGTQTTYPLNDLTDGTNIIISTDLKLDLLTPSMEDEIILNYTNEDATVYEDEGKETANVSYVAPTGVISVNTVSDYNGENSKVTSVEQGTKTDKIEIFDDAKTAIMDILVMNNNKNICKDVKILGRIPFKGNKDVTTGEDLGTTIDTNLVSGIVSNQNNKANVVVYYSENGEATEDLNNPNNGWVKDVTDFSKIKSYLIVAEGYEMGNADILRFSYEYRIPENLEHNNYIYGSFETIYTNVTDIKEQKEVSAPDLVGLTTGKGPNLSVDTNISTGDDSIKEFEKVKYTAKVTNTGEEAANDVRISTELPDGTTLVEYQKQGSLYEEKGWKYVDGKEKVVEFDEIKPGETKTIEFVVEATNITPDDNLNLTWKTEVNAKDLAKTLESDVIEKTIEKADIVTEEVTETIADIVQENDNLTYKIAVKNTSDSEISNVKVEKDLPRLLKYDENYVQAFDQELNLVKQTSGCEYDIDNRKVTWTIDSIKPGSTKYVVLNAVAGDLAEDVYEDVIRTNSKVTANSNTYYTGEIVETIAKPKLVVEQVSNQEGSYVREGDEIKYTLKVRNEGIVQANQVQVIDKLPDELKVRSLSYEIDGAATTRTVSRNEDAVVYASIAPNSELLVNLSAVADSIGETQKSVVNYANVESSNADTRVTNKVDNIIEKTVQAKAVNNDDGDIVETADFNKQVSDQANAVTEGRFKIAGTAWFDVNENGEKDDRDNGMEGIEVTVVDPLTGKRVQTTTTSQNGDYSFSNLPNGQYYLVFFYNDTRYGITSYKKSGVIDNLNSDVISAQVEEDGVVRNVAVSDTITIENGSVSNVNIGLMAASIFDLSLEKTVSSITVQNSNGTKKYDYDNLKLAKVEIQPKDLADTKVYVEYKLKVKNEGDVEGYAKRIVDYLPAGMEFSAELNPNWYKGSDGNLYNEELTNTPLAKGAEKTITLILSKEMTEDNTGIVNNTAEIAVAYNKLGIADRDSTPGNRNQGEDDLGSADTILSITTGNTLLYISIIITVAVIAVLLLITIRINRYKIKWYLKKKEVV